MPSVGQLSSTFTIDQFTVLLVPLFGCTLLASVLAVVAYQYRHRSGAVPLFFLLVGTAIWTFTYGMQLGQTTLQPKLFWSRLTYIGVLSVPVSLLVFTLTYTGRDSWLTPSRLAIICFVPALELFVALFFTRVLMPKPGIVERGGLSLLDFEGSILWILLLIYLYALIVVSAILVAIEFVQSYRVGRFRGQMLSILFAMCIPLGMDIYAQVTGINVALAPIGLTIAGALLSVAVFRYQLFDVSPVARRTVIEQMDDGFIVVDYSGTIIDTNEVAVEIAPSSDPSLLNRELADVFPQLAAVTDATTAESIPDEIEIPGADRQQRQQTEYDNETEQEPQSSQRKRIYEVDRTELTDARENEIATALVFRDVTRKRRRQQELREQKQRLERKTEQLAAQNERLDDFASLLSHDIRNPLGVARGYLDLLDVEEREEALDKVENALERIEQLVDEALQLAKEGHSVTETETVAVATIVDRAWDAVETGDGSLNNESGDLTVDADPPRLQRLLENLFRNAIEHCQPGVTITVTATENGFVVADDGPGIPEADRDEIFEKGYTTADDGTGFGLAIVETIVTAHGWTVSIEESDGGGAAFVIDCQLAESGES